MNVIDVRDAEADPCAGVLATATLVATPRLRLKVTGVAAEPPALYATNCDTSPVTGAESVAEMVSVKDCVPVDPPESVTKTVKLLVVATEGVPDSTPPCRQEGRGRLEDTPVDVRIVVAYRNPTTTAACESRPRQQCVAKHDVAAQQGTVGIS